MNVAEEVEPGRSPDDSGEKRTASILLAVEHPERWPMGDKHGLFVNQRLECAKILYLFRFRLFEHATDERWGVLVANDVELAELNSPLVHTAQQIARAPFDSAAHNTIVVPHDEENRHPRALEDTLQLTGPPLQCPGEDRVSRALRRS